MTLLAAQVLALDAATTAATASVIVALITTVGVIWDRRDRDRKTDEVKQEAERATEQAVSTQTALAGMQTLVEALQRDNERLRSGVAKCEGKCDELRQEIARLRRGAT